MHQILNEPIQIDRPTDNKSTVRVAIIVDESGSMLGATEATVNSLNAYLDEQATNNDPTVVSLYTFNSNTGVLDRFRSVNAKDSPRLKRNNDLFENPDIDRKLIYAPTGGTPLYDAIATVISEETTGIPTLVVVLTDGYENSSKEYPRLADIQTLIKKQEDEGWTFTFLCAGLSREESVSYTSNLMGRDYGAATMTYEKGAEDQAIRGLAISTRSWDTETRHRAATGEKLDVKKFTDQFYAANVRDVKKK